MNAKNKFKKGFFASELLEYWKCCEVNIIVLGDAAGVARHLIRRCCSATFRGSIIFEKKMSL